MLSDEQKDYIDKLKKISMESNTTLDQLGQLSERQKQNIVSEFSSGFSNYLDEQDLINDIKQQVLDLIERDVPLDSASHQLEEGVLLSGEEALMIIAALSKGGE